MKFRSDMQVDLVNHWADDEMAARAAKTSTNTDLLKMDKIAGLIRYLIRKVHSSPFEHSGATFRMEVPLFVRDQIVRHRTFSYSIRSFRFGEADPEFYVTGADRPLYNAGSGAHPDLVSDHPDGRPLHLVVAEEFEHAHKQAWISYRNMVEYGVAEEVARGVLPTNLYTSMYMTGNLWNWLKFLDKRISSDNNDPQFETEQVALQIAGVLAEKFPLTYDAWEEFR